jgi:elongation factor 1-beta
MPEMRIHRSITRGPQGGQRTMGSVIITYKIFPTDIVENFDELKKKIESQLPEFSSVEGYGEEPVAFGLKALLVQMKFPEDKTGILDELEKKLEGIEGVSQIQTLMVRRTSR